MHKSKILKYFHPVILLIFFILSNFSVASQAKSQKADPFIPVYEDLINGYFTDRAKDFVREILIHSASSVSADDVTETIYRIERKIKDANIKSVGTSIAKGFVEDAIADGVSEYVLQKTGSRYKSGFSWLITKEVFAARDVVAAYSDIKNQSWKTATAKAITVKMHIARAQADVLYDVGKKDLEAAKDFKEAWGELTRATTLGELQDLYNDGIKEYLTANSTTEQLQIIRKLKNSASDLIDPSEIYYSGNIFDIREWPVLVPDKGKIKSEIINAWSSSLEDRLNLEAQNRRILLDEFISQGDFDKASTLVDSWVLPYDRQKVRERINAESTFKEYYSSLDAGISDSLLMTGLESTISPSVSEVQDDLIEDILTEAEAEAPVTPVTSNKVGFITAANATPSSTFLLTKDATAIVTTGSANSAPISSSDGNITITADNKVSSSYQYLSWGKYTGSSVSYLDTETGQTHGLQNLFWLYGDDIAIPSSYFQNKTGTATYAGNVYGDYALTGTNETFYNSVTGNADFTIKFSDNSVTGNLSTATNYMPSGLSPISRNANFTLAGDFMTGNIGGIAGAGLSTKVKSFGSDVGELGGAFFGANGEEFGGTFFYFDATGGASGVVVAKEGATPVVPLPTTENWQGYIAAKVKDSSLLFTVPNVVIDNDSTNAPTSGQDNFTAASISPQITASTSKGNYTYTTWGSWSGSGVTINSSDIEQAKIVIGRLTSTSEMPSNGTRNFGGASHNSQVAGIGFNGEQIGGNVALSADFGNGNVSGNFAFTADGSAWVDGTISNTPIQGNWFVGSNNLNITQGGNGKIQGSFYGTNANEVGGSWAIWNVPSTTAGADGVFRAKQ